MHPSSIHRRPSPPSRILPWVWAGLALPCAAGDSPVPSQGSVFDVRAFGAAGDGKTLDTRAIQAAIDACSEAGGGKVVLTAGTYLSGSIHLRSRITLALDAAARLVGTSDTEAYNHYTLRGEAPHLGLHPEFLL